MMPALTIPSISARRSWTHKGEQIRVKIDSAMAQTDAMNGGGLRNRSQTHRRSFHAKTSRPPIEAVHTNTRGRSMTNATTQSTHSPKPANIAEAEFFAL